MEAEVRKSNVESKCEGKSAGYTPIDGRVGPNCCGLVMASYVIIHHVCALPVYCEWRELESSTWGTAATKSRSSESAKKRLLVRGKADTRLWSGVTAPTARSFLSLREGASSASSARRSLPQSLRRGIESTGCIACDPRCTARWVSQQCPAHPPGIGRTQRTPLRSSSSLPGSTLSSVRLFSHWLSLVIPFVPPGNALAASG